MIAILHFFGEFNEWVQILRFQQQEFCSGKYDDARFVCKSGGDESDDQHFE